MELSLLLALIGGVLLLLGIASSVLKTQANNQLVPPFPGPTAPVVDDLPRLVSHLRASKARGEARCRAAQKFIQARGLRAGVLEGEGLYGDAQAEFNGCVSYLAVAVARRFTEDDPARIATDLKSADARLDAFVEWVDSLDRAPIGDLPWAELTDLLSNLVQWSADANERAVDLVVAELEECRWKTWDELAGEGGVAAHDRRPSAPPPPAPDPYRAMPAPADETLSPLPTPAGEMLSPPPPPADDDVPELPIEPVRPTPVRRPRP